MGTEKINNTPLPATKARRRLIYRLVREIADDVQRDTGRTIDTDRLEQTVEIWLPLTHAEAEAAFARAIAADASFADAWLGRGTLALSLGRHDDALAALDMLGDSVRDSLKRKNDDA